MPSRFFDDPDLLALKSVYDQARDKWGITLSDADASRREDLARLILALAQNGERDPDVLLRRVLLRLRNVG